MNFKEFRKKNREKRKVFRLHALISMASLALTFLTIIFKIELGFHEIYFMLFIYMILSLFFDKGLRIKIYNFLKKAHNKMQNDNRG